MAATSLKIAGLVVIIVLVGMLSPVPSAADQVQDCIHEIYSLLPCLSYINNASANLPTGCCLSLAEVVRSRPICLCPIVDGSASKELGIPIDENRALTLPGACHVQTPPISDCNGGSNTVTAPPVSDPKPDATTSNGRSTKVNLTLLFFILCVLSTWLNWFFLE